MRKYVIMGVQGSGKGTQSQMLAADLLHYGLYLDPREIWDTTETRRALTANLPDLTPERLEKATSFFERHGGKIIIVARFIEGLRQANGIIAGISGLRWTRFLVFNAIGAALWVAVWTSVGYFSGSHIDTIYADATRYDKYLVVALALLVAAYVALRMRRARRPRGPDTT